MINIIKNFQVIISVCEPEGSRRSHDPGFGYFKFGPAWVGRAAGPGLRAGYG